MVFNVPMPDDPSERDRMIAAGWQLEFPMGEPARMIPPPSLAQAYGLDTFIKKLAADITTDTEDRWRLVRVSTDLLSQWGTRTERGERITAEWGDPDSQGIYEPVFSTHSDDVLGELDTAWREAETALPAGHTIDLVLESHVDGRRYLAWTMRHTDTAIIRGEGPTPSDALRALAEKLRGHAATA